MDNTGGIFVMKELEKFTNSPNFLEKYYTDFNVSNRILLTGHSHQALPDTAKNGLMQCWKDAAEYVDNKWVKVFEKSDEVRTGFSELTNDDKGYYALASNTHELLIRFLSSLDLKNRRKIITSDMEFHTVRRQLDRLSETDIEIIKVPAMPAETVSERISNLIDNDTACVIISKVYYKNGRIVENLGHIAQQCNHFGAELLVDVYHALNILEFDIEKEGLNDCYLVGGGYKYCQLGEGNCFLRFPKNSKARPVITGWFSEFSLLASEKSTGLTNYGNDHFRFAGSTYDPCSHYRAAEVFKFFREMELHPALLRAVNQQQIAIMADYFDNCDFDPTVISRDNEIPLSKFGGFLVLRSKYAREINKKLFDFNIFSDYREDFLRLGPAPYISNNKLSIAMETLEEIVKRINGINHE